MRKLRRSLHAESSARQYPESVGFTQTVDGGTKQVNTGSAGASPAKACAARSILIASGNKGGSRFALIAGEAPALPVLTSSLSQIHFLGKKPESVPFA